MYSNKTGIIILAAGSSSRMGRPKQLLVYQENNFLQNTITACVSYASNNTTVVVLGAHHNTITSSTNITKVPICFNENWSTGIASSIKCGLHFLLDLHEDMNRCIITVCDQPHIDSTVFKTMEEIQRQTNKGIVAAQYAKTLGVPAMFTKPYFNLLLSLSGEQGAKKIIHQHINDVASFSFANGEIDIDTKEDYEALITPI
jgi:molybdenum cofactor cytidylyltransferase